MPNAAALLIATLLAIAPVAESGLTVEAEGLDLDALEAGLRMRVGDTLDRWSIAIEAEGVDRYRVELRRVGSKSVTDRRSVTLEGPSDDDRSRELAAMLALILEDADDEVGARAPERGAPQPALALPIGFVALETHIGLGPPRKLDPDFGLGLGGGAWLLGDHLQPRARVGWSHSRLGAIQVHQVNAGIGLAGGAGFGRLWVGALLMPALKWTYAAQLSSSSGWFGGGEASLIAQYRAQRLVLGLRTGIETTFPAVRVPGTQDVVRWGHVRWLCVLEVGFGI